MAAILLLILEELPLKLENLEPILMVMKSPYQLLIQQATLTHLLCSHQNQLTYLVILKM